MAPLHKKIAGLRTALSLAMGVIVVAHHLLVQRLPQRIHLDSELLLYGVGGPIAAWVLLGWLARSVAAAEAESAERAERNRQIEALFTASRLLAGARRLEDVAPSLVALAVELSRARGGAMVWYASQQEGPWVVGWGSLAHHLDLEEQVRSPCTGCDAPHCASEPGWRCLPIAIGPEILGLLWLDQPDWDAPTQRGLQTLVGEIAMAWWGHRAEGRALSALGELSADVKAARDLGRAASRFVERVLPAIGATSAAFYRTVERKWSAQFVVGQTPPPPPEGSSSGFRSVQGGREIYLPAGRGQVLALSFSAPYSLRSRDYQLLHVVAAQAGFLVQLGEEASGLVWRERSRIARELHDSLAQEVAFLHLELRRLERYYPELADLRQHALAVYEEIRKSIEDLQIYPRTGEAAGAFLKRLAEAFARREGVELEAHIAEDLELAQEVVEQLARVLQEALTNAVRHGMARRLEVRLERIGGGIRLTVRDDGIGFEPDRLPPGGHHGLRIMRERMEELGGRLWVESRPGGGTTVHALLEEVSDRSSGGVA